MRRILLIVLPLLALAGAAPSSAPAMAGPSVATIAPADLVDPAALRASAGLVLRIPAPGEERGRRLWQAQALARMCAGSVLPAVALGHAPQRRPADNPDFRAADALHRAGIDLWGTAAPPPFRPI